MTAGTSGPFQAQWRWHIAVVVISLTLLAAPLTLMGQALPAPWPDEKIPVVVLDPGRGGSNVGGSGATGLLEKDITLQLATEAAEVLAVGLVANFAFHAEVGVARLHVEQHIVIDDAADAAAQGLGVALVRLKLGQPWLENGTLERVSARNVPMNASKSS